MLYPHVRHLAWNIVFYVDICAKLPRQFMSSLWAKFMMNASRGGANPRFTPTLSEAANTKNYMWQDWVNAVLGLVIIAVAFFGAATVGATLGWTFGILGAVIAVVGFWGTGVASETTVRHA